ncbi:sarcosine oxidase subunit gamma [Sulfitobacter sp. JBTF-M27]|uniref:Sarcosine oxidase subunit gamma n=1 Tax=Sulfitobacter sediminilitoris TaxID=2698830 RepID=A0A6P0CEN6_9RHOB|nr:sarcosine oxidase subunit gamma [Sulfitobacter sediminilitoris]NEK24649.1 sarcosine oxidase subunit gamma [Sulfitobacter sediminilitoris]
MVELIQISPCAGLLPITLGSVTLDEQDVGRLTSLSPFGDASDLSAALEKAHGCTWPKPNRSTGKDGGRCIWFGRDEALLIGPAPDMGLAKHGAVVDQSDAWAVVSLAGPGAVDVLARLVPVDLRDAAFKRGHTVRTQVMHMNASITKLGTDHLMIMVFRSMAGTLVYDLKGAMAAVASRG